jgi:6-phosphogluconolactonase
MRLTVRSVAVGAAVVAGVVYAGPGWVTWGQTPPQSVPSDRTLVYVGTYTTGKSTSKGIYAFELQTPEATLRPLGLVAETVNPSYFDIDEARRLLFAVNEVGELNGEKTGGVSAFSIDRATGRLTFLNQRASKGTAPCFLRLDKSGRHALVANYGSGSIAVLPIGADGRLGDASSVVQHTGSSVHPQRQRGPHAHCLVLDPANRFAFACDLGLDKVLIYRFDAATGTLTPNDPAFASVEPGAGPRAMAFRPDGRFAYLGNEMQSTVTAFSYDANAGRLTEIQTISTLPADFSDNNSIAEVAVHPSGKYLYVSNRGHNSVAVFAIDPEKGTLTFVAHQSTGGRTPRHFGIDPSGRFLIAANQQSDTLVPHSIDPGTGQLKAATPATAPTPVYVAFLPPPEIAR